MVGDHPGCGTRTDADLIFAARAGDVEAFGELYVRYFPLAYRFACRLLGTVQGADDVVAEAFAKVLKRLAVGGGPKTIFRAYLFTTVRTTMYKYLAEDRMVDRQIEISDNILPTTDVDPVVHRLDVDLALRAFASLSERWQLVLRYLEVEDKSTAAVAELLGIQSNAVAALAFRARDGLRLAYLQMHVRTDVAAGCSETRGNLAAWLCGRLNRSVRVRVQEHLGECEGCACASVELADLLTELRRMVPLVVT